MRMKRWHGLLLLLITTGVLQAQEIKPPYWEDIQAFKKQDSLQFPGTNKILFVGSSSFTNWKDVQDYFPSYPIINRGFGGSSLPDVIRYSKDVIFPYRPKQIVIYCGENDLAASDTVTAKMVFSRFVQLFNMIRTRLPAVPIIYISMKPSPSRQLLTPKMREGNSMIRSFLKKKKKTVFVDVYREMIDDEGKPIPELFLEDQLHMNKKGYGIWQKAIEPYLIKNDTELKSPDGNIVFKLNLKDSSPSYSLSYKNNLLIENSFLNLDLDGLGMLNAASMEKAPVFKEVKENYELFVGKASKVSNHYRQATIYLQDGKNKDYHFSLEVRAFNDGLAFRYVLPKLSNHSSFTLLDEQTQFRFMSDPVVKALLLPDFFSSHEGLYTTMPLSKIKEDTLMDMPALFQFPNKIFLAITEAALLDYAGMYLVNHNGILCGKLSPLPNQQKIKVKAVLPHVSPWRVLLISDRVGALIESNIITSLNEPTAIQDLSWLHPGTSTFPWWNGTIIPDNVVGGNNFETNKYYIDFCAANNIRYHSVVEYGGHEWYTNDGSDYQPGPNADITKPVAGLDMKQICDYAKSKNVEVRVWTHWKALYPKLDTAFALFQKWGLSGMMVDFMDRDDQEMVNIQTEILKKAAAHHLHIQFHGAYKPTGLSRTYPNEFTREGTLNYEHDKWDNLVNPNADINIPFTRMLAGSTDYHLGGFRALPYSKFIVQNFRPYVMGTRCHMLAMYVVLESYLGMVCDYPDAYIGQPGFEVIQGMPTTWDETHVPAAEVDQYVSIARRKKDTWYVGTITDSSARQIDLPLSFLPVGKFTADIYSDAPDADVNANLLTRQTVTVDRTTSLKLSLASGGGNIIILNKLKK